ncbi:MAG TPA: excinuclease ABC subunit UvrA, partial [Fibrella sp.]
MLTDVQLTGHEQIDVLGAREHNLKNIDVSIPRNKLVVVTGISGSGKSSLAFDTIYAEGQRRYMESFSAYARSFLGNMERPDVDKINGLSPVISIEQKTTSKNPRSTVGTTTEIFDFLRLLYARAGEAYSYMTGRKMIRQSQDQIVDTLLDQYAGKKTTLLAPVVRGRKGHYRELFLQIAKLGYTKVRVDGVVQDIVPKMQVDRYKVHDIEIVIDRLVPTLDDRFRLSQSVQVALKQGKGAIQVLDYQDKLHFFSQNLMDPESGISYDEPSPNSFSFNSPYGWCPSCQGLGVVEEITEDSVIPDKSLSISRGAIAPLGEYRELWFFKEVEVILKKYKMNLTTPVSKYPAELLHVLLHGTEDEAAVPSKKHPGEDYYSFKFEGIINFLKRQQETGSEKIQEWLRDFLVINTCPECNGARLKRDSQYFR